MNGNVKGTIRCLLRNYLISYYCSLYQIFDEKINFISSTLYKIDQNFDIKYNDVT